MFNTKNLPMKRYVIAGLVCAVLVLQASAMRILKIDETSLALPGLHTLPMQLGTWKAPHEDFMDANTVAYLKPDEYILRDYADARSAASINLFVAYFRSLQSKYGPHSPRICLPGAGWLVSSSKIIQIPVPGKSQGIPVNQFTMEKADQHILVLYWYQNDRDIWAEDFYGKLRLLPDLVRYRRSDVSLVRLIAPYQGSTPTAELKNCSAFAQRVYPLLTERFGSAH